MKNLTKKALTLLLAVMLVMSVCAQALAVDTDTNSNFRVSDDPAVTDTGVDYFNLIKDYDNTNSVSIGTTPAETFTFKITPFAVWNAGSKLTSDGATPPTYTEEVITKDTMPLFAAPSTVATGTTYNLNDGTRTLTITQDVNAGDTLSARVDLPTYDTVGDYWYQVQEMEGSTIGVIYGTNDLQSEALANSNGAHNAKYYIHVQVIDVGTGGTKTLVRNVTMHKTPPVEDPTANPLVPYDTDAAYNSNYGFIQKTDGGSTVNGKYYVDNAQSINDKVNSVQNKYYAGSLTIKKAVTGNAGDKTMYFPVTVVFTKPSGTIINSDIAFNAPLQTVSGSDTTYASTDVTILGQYSNTTADATHIRWMSGSSVAGANSTAQLTATATFYVKDGTTVTFSNIPYGVTYSVKETLPANDNYQNEINVSASKDDAATFDAMSLGADTNSASMSTDDTKTASGSISDASDEVTITNQKNIPIDVGVITENAPYVALVAVAAAGIILLAIRRKKAVED